MKPAPPVMRTRSDNWAPPHDSVAGYGGNAAIAWLVWLAGRNPVLSPAPVIASIQERQTHLDSIRIRGRIGVHPNLLWGKFITVAPIALLRVRSVLIAAAIWLRAI